MPSSAPYGRKRGLSRCGIRSSRPNSRPTPFRIAHLDLEDGLYTQRDMIRIPSDVSGEIVLSLWLEGRDEPLSLQGSRMCLSLDGNPRYVRHLD